MRAHSLIGPASSRSYSGVSKCALSFSIVALLALAGAQGRSATASSAESMPASQPATIASVRFAAVDVFVDSGSKPLAAYQLELTATKGEVKIVGIEGGEHAAFRTPPYYDPAAMMHDRVILAAFNTGTSLPSGKGRVARIHVQISGEVAPQYESRLVLAASSDGRRIAATAFVE